MARYFGHAQANEGVLMTAFQRGETQRQGQYKRETWPCLPNGTHGGRHYSHILPADHLEKNFYPPIFSPLKEYWKEKDITLHSSIHNLKSSQACCFNFLFYWRMNLDRGNEVLSSILSEVQQISDIEFEYTGPDGATEWLGEPEGGKRGQNRTSVDAAIWWKDRAGGKRLTLIEWKYTENSFGGCGGYVSKGNHRKDKCYNLAAASVKPREDCYVSTEKDIRTKRKYWHLLKESGIVVSRFTEKGCPFRGPWYQLLRLYLLRQYCQQSIAEVDTVDVTVVGFEENWRNLLRVPAYMGNKGNDVIEVWNDLLEGVPSLRKVAVENLLSIAGKLSSEHQEWREYIGNRYGV